MALGRTIPALPVSDIGRAVQYYTEQLGFALPHRDDGFASNFLTFFCPFDP